MYIWICDRPHLKKRGLKVSGKKSEIIKRLSDAIEDEICMNIYIHTVYIKYIYIYYHPLKT